MKKKNKIKGKAVPINSIQNPVSPNRPFISPMVDPDGSWTGTSYASPKEMPVQDADDL